MTTQSITARFPTAQELDAALFELRRAGAVCHTGTLPPGPLWSPPTLHFTVRSADAVLARTIVRRTGGQLIS